MKRSNGSAEALGLWRRVAAGERGPDIDAWLQSVAQKLVNDVFTAPPVSAKPAAGGRHASQSRRAENALRAVGFNGGIDRHHVFRLALDAIDVDRGAWTARDFAETWSSFEVLGADGVAVPDQPDTGTVTQLTKLAKNHRSRGRR